MATIISKLIVDVARADRYQSIAAKQYDTNSRFIKITFLNQGVPVDLPSGAIARANFKREDGQSFSSVGQVDEDGDALISLSGMALQNAGSVLCSASVFGDDDEILTSMSFVLEVQAAEGTADGQIEICRVPGGLDGQENYHVEIGGVSYTFMTTNNSSANCVVKFSSDFTKVYVYDNNGSLSTNGEAVTVGTSGTLLEGGLLVSMIDDIVSQASSATSIAQSVRDDADSGAFDGASVVGLEIVLNHLICTLSDGTVIDAGVIPGALSDAVSKSAQAAKDSTMTQAVGIDSDGKLWSVPGGSGGTSDYDELTNRPQINSVTLTGDKSFEDLGLDTAELEEATEVEVPLYTITDALDVSVTLKNYDTTVFSDGAVSTITAALPTPVSGNDYLTGVIFEAASGQTFTVTCPTGYALKWIGNAAPTFTAGKIYEIIFRCLWLSNGSGDIIISANWSEV